MNDTIHQFIASARKDGRTDTEIIDALTAAGWDRAVVEGALTDGADKPLVAPPPPTDTGSPANDPKPVVQALSTRGLEYTIMFISLAVFALSLGWILHSLINGATGTSNWVDNSVSFATAALIVSLPIFAFLFLRLKKAEIANSQLHDDPSRHRAIQIMLVLTFLVGLGNIITFLYSLLNGGNATAGTIDSSTATTIVGNALHLLVTLAIAGTIFGYYWYEEHRGRS